MKKCGYSSLHASNHIFSTQKNVIDCFNGWSVIERIYNLGITLEIFSWEEHLSNEECCFDKSKPLQRPCLKGFEFWQFLPYLNCLDKSMISVMLSPKQLWFFVRFPLTSDVLCHSNPIFVWDQWKDLKLLCKLSSSSLFDTSVTRTFFSPVTRNWNCSKFHPRTQVCLKTNWWIRYFRALENWQRNKSTWYQKWLKVFWNFESQRSLR